MQQHIKLITPKSGEYPSPLRDKKNRDLFPKIWALGDVIYPPTATAWFFLFCQMPRGSDSAHL